MSTASPAIAQTTDLDEAFDLLTGQVTCDCCGDRFTPWITAFRLLQCNKCFNRTQKALRDILAS